MVEALSSAGVSIVEITMTVPDALSLLGQRPQLEIVPTGGVNPSNAAEFMSKGATAVGVGSSLVDRELLLRERWDELVETAAAFVKDVSLARP